MIKIQAACLILGTLTTHQILANEGPVGVSVQSVQYAGTGCPVGSGDVLVNFDQEGQTLLLNLPEMIAQWAPEIAKIESRKSCTVSLGLQVPEGWQYTLAGFETRGFMSLDAGMKSEITLQNYFEGSAGVQRVSLHAEGPRYEDFIIKDFFPMSSQLWSSCGVARKMHINLAAKLFHANPKTYPHAQAWLIVGSDWLPSSMKIAMNWRRCI